MARIPSKYMYHSALVNFWTVPPVYLLFSFKKKRKVTCDKPVTVNVQLLCKLCFVHCTLQYPVIDKNIFLKQNEMHNFVHLVYMQ